MSQANSSAIRLLLVHDTQNEAEPVANAIRNSGQAIRSHFVATVDELEQLVSEQTWDVMIAKLSTHTLDTSEAVACVVRDGKDIPMIGLVEHYDQDIISSAIDMGMADVVVEAAEQHLVQVVRREINALKSRREFRSISVALRETEKRCQLLLENSVDAIGYVHEGMHIYANHTYMEMFGYDDLEDLQCAPIMDLVASEEVGRLKASLKSFSEGNSEPLTINAKNSDDETFSVVMSFSEATYEGELCTQIVIQKQQLDNDLLQEKIREASSLDVVSGLINKVTFNDKLDTAYNTVLSQGKRYLVGHIGISNFAEIKKAAGIGGSDVIIKELAEVLTSGLSKGSTLSRYSDDMMALIDEQADLKTVQQQWQSLQEKVSDYLFEVDGRTIPVTLTCGFAHLDESCSDGKQALVQADQAYNQAIKKSLAQQYFDKSDIANVADNSLIAQIEHAVVHNRFRVQFQPVMSLRGDSQEHYEIFLRLQDKDGSDISPADFLPSLENSDLSLKIDRWVVNHSLASLTEHRKRGHNTQIMIHLTAPSIQDPTFLPWVNSQLREHKLPGDAICFQISEAIALSHLKIAKAFSKGLSLLKCNLAISNFGLTDKGLTLSRHLDINYIRIDGSLVDAMFEAGKASDEVVELLNSIHKNDINSIVPRIENAEVLASLWELGVNYIQGFYLQPPLDDMDYNFDADEEEAV